ncbi:hypothetical protein IFR05_007510 [Cadophora sp. M221]|nr:hypothetical protein IFR05_007510 [Cadophora sp. M221]
MSESGVSQRTESEVDNDENMMRGNRGGSACSPSAQSLKKGKGGRKVMFPSAEEKKQRNRDSQAAFRERRKEHISELENIVQEQKEKLQESKNAQASAKEEVLILKYKNSLLERILLEQGIDVNAELNNILVFPPRLPEKRVRKERVLARPDPEVVSSKRVTAMTSSSPKTTSECCHYPCATTSTATLILDDESDAAQSVWAPTPPLPFEVEHEHRHGAAKTQNPAKAAFDFDFDFEADFSFGSFAEAAGGFDMDLGFLSSVHV